MIADVLIQLIVKKNKKKPQNILTLFSPSNVFLNLKTEVLKKILLVSRYSALS